jgi:hypothetical protein
MEMTLIPEERRRFTAAMSQKARLANKFKVSG